MRRSEIVVQTTGDVLDGAREYVRRQVGTFMRRVPARMAATRVRLTGFMRPNAPWPALTQANLVVDGNPVRAQVAAKFFHEAGRLLRDRLGMQVARLADPHMVRPWPAARSLLEPVPLRSGQRRIARVKCYSLTRCSVAQAALTMDLMDYDFHLFIDDETGEDSVVYRVGPTGYRLARLAGMAPPEQVGSVPLTMNVHPVPELSQKQAGEVLDATDLPFRFYRDAATGRGHMLYRRFDGHYGLISPDSQDAAE